METFMETVITLGTDIGKKILFALLVLAAGRILIRNLMRFLTNGRLMSRADGEVKTFALSFCKIGLYVLLIISIIGILGVPMASIVTVLASAGVAVALALQGALANLAGGIMLMLLRPFKLGDYVEASSMAGTVSEVTLFYTIFTTVDNKRITVPNGTLMNANIVNYSAERIRRVDLTFTCGRNEDIQKIRKLILDTVHENSLVLTENVPDLPFARLAGTTGDALEFSVRVWVYSADYWKVYHDLTEAVTEAFQTNQVSVPGIHILESR